MAFYFIITILWLAQVILEMFYFESVYMVISILVCICSTMVSRSWVQKQWSMDTAKFSTFWWPQRPTVGSEGLGWSTTLAWLVHVHYCNNVQCVVAWFWQMILCSIKIPWMSSESMCQEFCGWGNHLCPNVKVDFSHLWVTLAIPEKPLIYFRN